MPSSMDDPAYSNRLLKAAVILMLERRGPELEAAERAEMLLDRAGFTAAEIAELLGKQPGAVRMALSRARKPRSDA